MNQITENKAKRLVIVGDGEFAAIAYEYFTYDSDYAVCAFAVERDYLNKDRLYGLPVVAFEDLEALYPPQDYEVYVAVTYTQLNRVRARLYRAAKAKGYRCASYISSRAFVWRNAEIGENSFIFENNVVQPFTQIGRNVVLWSGNHIGHRTVIRDNCYLSSHIVISGYCDIGENCFIGVNATFADNVSVAPDCFIAMAAGVMKSLTQPDGVYKGTPAQAGRLSAKKYMKVKE